MRDNLGGVLYLWFTTAVLLVGGVGVGQLGFPEAGSDGPVLCDDKVMGPGDRCLVMFDGSRTSHSYEDLHAEKLAGQGWDPLFLVIGGLMLAGGLVCLGYLVRRYRR
jgi:hypothetical protein